MSILPRAAAGGILLTLALTACTSPAPDPIPTRAAPPAPPADSDSAPWSFSTSPDPDSTTLHVEVWQVRCSGGAPPDVSGSVVVYGPDRIYIGAYIHRLPPGDYFCNGGPPTDASFTLDEAVGNREIVDTACLNTRIATSYNCMDGAVRWTPKVLGM